MSRKAKKDKKGDISLPPPITHTLQKKKGCLGSMCPDEVAAGLFSHHTPAKPQ